MHIEVTGSGEPLVLLHGWGMHGGVWRDVAQRLSLYHEVHLVDLPGHGLSKVGWVERSDTHRPYSANDGYRCAPPILQAGPAPFSLEDIVCELSAHFNQPVNLLGWSLGGIIAQHWAARDPVQIQRLVLVASTPCFTEREDWLFGMPRAVLEKFAAELEHNHAATLRRFISLQLRGSENERELLTQLREQLFSRGEPDMQALRGGLEILRDADQRSEATQISQPTLIIAGQRDKLTPPEASYYLAQVIPNAKVVEIEGAAHAPFLSHPDIFIEYVNNFLHEKHESHEHKPQ